MPDTTVKYFDSTMSGASELSNVAGSLITLLDACLVNGFGSVTLDSLIITDNVATATKTGHGFAMVGNTGPVVKIEGATPAGLNTEWRIASVPDANTFTFATSGITNQTATGTITAKRAPAGFSKAFSGTNKAAYQSDDIAGTQLYCRIDDTTTSYSRIRGYEAMDDVDTVTTGYGMFPTEAQLSGGGYVYKATGTARPWALVSDGRLIFFFCDTVNNDVWSGGFVFGDIETTVGSDAYHCALIASITSTGAHQLYLVNSTSGSWLARRYTQLLGSYASARYAHPKSTFLGAGGETYPAVANNALRLAPIECWEGALNFRGLLPGLYCPVHSGGIDHGVMIEDIPGLSGHTLKTQLTNTYAAVMDLTGPWR